MPFKTSAERLAYMKEYREKNKEILKQKRAEQKEYYSKTYKEWAQENREKRNETLRGYRRTLRGRYSEIKKRCKQLSRLFNLTFEEYCQTVSEPCFYCVNRFGKPVEAGSGLDRIDSNLGYESGNVVSCCKNCNTVKSNLISLEEMKAVMSLILQLRGL